MSLRCLLAGLALIASPALAQPPRPAPVGAAADYHVHVKGDLTLDEALRRSREDRITYGVAVNGGVGFPIDTARARVAGGDVLKVLEKHGARLNDLHFKDAVLPFRRPDFFPNLRDLGKGEVDFPGVMRALNVLEYRGWINLEQDFTATSPRESSQASFRYVREVLGRA